MTPDDRSESETGPLAPPSSPPPTTTALAVRRACAHRWDLLRRTCLVCGERVYVEVVIS